MKAVIANTEAIRLAEHDCESWFEAYEWVDKYCRENGLRTNSKHIEDGLLYVWVVKS